MGPKSLCSTTPLVFNPPPPTEGFPGDDLCKILTGCRQMANVPNGVETLSKISIAWVRCTNVTYRQTDGRTMTFTSLKRVPPSVTAPGDTNLSDARGFVNCFYSASQTGTSYAGWYTRYVCRRRPRRPAAAHSRSSSTLVSTLNTASAVTSWSSAKTSAVLVATTAPRLYWNLSLFLYWYLFCF